jgi:hypothetical protein
MVVSLIGIGAEIAFFAEFLAIYSVCKSKLDFKKIYN